MLCSLLQGTQGLLCFLIALPYFIPARRLRQLAAQEPDNDGSKRTYDEQPAPASEKEMGGNHIASQKALYRHAQKAKGVRPGGIPTTRIPGNHLSEVGIGERRFRAQTYACQEAKHDHPQIAEPKGSNQCKCRVNQQRRHIHRAPSKIIGDDTKYDRAKKHANEARADNERRLKGVEVEYGRQYCAKHAAKKDIVQIEEGANAQHKRQPAMKLEKR